MYPVIKVLAKLALPFYCRRILINDSKLLKSSGPLLLACNHPNSFFDAILLGALFNRPVHFLTRGDAFRNRILARLLHRLKAIPVYRLSEGRENLALNDETFRACREVLQQSGIILIFSEGVCEHEWRLRPLKKGTARIALQAWEEVNLGSLLRVVPVSLNYDSFRGPGKNILIHFGRPLTSDVVMDRGNAQQRMAAFNRELAVALQEGLLTNIPGHAPVACLLSVARKTDDVHSLKTKQHQLPAVADRSDIAFILLFIPALTGWLLHAPYYYLIKWIAVRNTKGTVFFDSVFFGLLMTTYPLYWLTLFAISLYTGVADITVTVLLMPALAYCTSFLPPMRLSSDPVHG